MSQQGEADALTSVASTCSNLYADRARKVLCTDECMVMRLMRLTVGMPEQSHLNPAASGAHIHGGIKLSPVKSDVTVCCLLVLLRKRAYECPSYCADWAFVA